MLAHDAAGSDDASVTNAQKICDIIIVDLNNREIPIKVSPPSGTTRRKSSACLTGQEQGDALKFLCCLHSLLLLIYY
jgi:hypothetical protein